VNVEPLARVSFDSRASYVNRFVRRIIKHLNLKPFSRVINLRYGLQQTLDYVHLVKERKLYGDARQIRLIKARLGLWLNLAIAPEVHDLFDAVAAVDGENQKDAEVQDENCPVNRVQAVERADVAGRFVDGITEARKPFAQVIRS
jgi:hypothetical protein